MNEPQRAVPAPGELPIFDTKTTPAQPVPTTSPWHVKQPFARPDQETIVISADHIIHRNNKDFVLYGGLLNAAHKAGLQSISTTVVQLPSQHNGQCAVVHATAEFPWGTFTGIGDADDENVSRNIAPHRIRMAETRAKARALRDALNVSMVAIEEMGPDPGEQPNPGKGPSSDAKVPSGGYRADPEDKTAAPRPVQHRPDGSSSVTSSPGTRKTYGTPLTRPAVQ